jgi:hypothetical protein
MKILATTGVSSPQMLVQDPSPTPFLPYQWILNGNEERLLDIPDEVWVRIKPQMDDFVRVGLLTYRDVSNQTYQDVTLYVSTLGSDATGLGSSVRPYGTVIRAFQDIPKKIDHHVRIFITEGEYANAFPSEINFEYGENGCLSIFGIGAPTVVAGPFTVESVSRNSTHTEIALEVDGVTWDANAFRGCWVQYELGALSGKAYSVYGNTADTVTSIADFTYHSLVEAGDTFSVIKPSVRFTGIYSLGIRHNTLNTTGASGGVWVGCSLQMSNITLDASASIVHADVFNMSANSQADGPFLDFVQFEAPLGSQAALSIYDICINWGYPKDFAAFGAADIGIVNLGSDFQVVGFQVYCPSTESNVVMIITGDCSLMSPAIDGAVYFYSGSMYAYFTLMRFLVIGVGASVSYILGEVESSPTLLPDMRESCVMCSGNASFVNCMFKNPEKNAIAVASSGEIAVYDCDVTGVPETTLSMAENTSCSLTRVLGDSFVGTTGVVTWKTTGDIVSAWPAAGSSITDGHGSYATRPTLV